MVDVVKGYALLIWSDPECSWVSIAVRSDRSVLDDLAERFVCWLPFHVRVIEVASLDDDAVEAAGRAEPWPDHVAFLHHESFGIE